jgi:prepilin peptidase CpaA
MGFTVILLGAASYTDLRWRRIPNYLTFPAIGVGLVLSLATDGWLGLLLSLGGAVLAPSILVLAHGGKGPGMGDIKLAAALGALLGPALGAAAMIVSMIAGAGVAMVWMAKEWGIFGHGKVKEGITRSLSRRGRRTEGGPSLNTGGLAIPYGLALAIGTLLTLVVSLWTGTQHWFLWFVTGGGTP